jgi:hypothetical protein
LSQREKTTRDTPQMRAKSLIGCFAAKKASTAARRCSGV